MPTYDYFCPSCEHSFEMVMPIALRKHAMCPTCGSAVEYVFTPTVYMSNLTELRDFPLKHDHIDGVRNEFSSKRQMHDYLKRYNDKMLAKGRDNWVATCPRLA